jgi:hypothetical protein
MSSESVCQVARSWVDVGSFHTRLFRVVYVTCGDFRDRSEKGTASVHKILRLSWEKCYRLSQWFSKSSGTESWVVRKCFNGISGSRPVALQLTMTNTGRPTSFTYPETSDYSRHCWWGGNLLWNMPTGCDERIGHEPCRSFTMTTSVSHFHPHPPVCGEIQNGCHPHPPYSPDLALCDFFLLKKKMKLKWRRFDTIEKIQTESQRVLDTDRKWLQESFKSGGDCGTGFYMWEETTSRVMAADRPYGEFYDS